MKYRIAYNGEIATSHEVDDDQIEEWFDAVADALHDLDGEDHSVSGSITERRIGVEVVVTANNPDEAARIGSGILRTAVHAAGGDTPGWSIEALDTDCLDCDDAFEVRYERHSVELTDLASPC